MVSSRQHRAAPISCQLEIALLGITSSKRERLAACKRRLQKWRELLAFHMTIFGSASASTKDSDCLVAIRARIRRSLDDPRPDMTIAEVDAHLAALFARAAQTGDHVSPFA
jgi:hypothetical protein